MESKNEIRFRNDFYSDENCFLSTYHDAPFKYSLYDEKDKKLISRKFRNIEQAFQFSRFYKNPTNPKEEEETKKVLNDILDEPSGVEVKKIGDKANRKDFRTNTLMGVGERPHWNSFITGNQEKNKLPFKYYVLFDIMFRKFSENKEAAEMLKRTKDHELIECSNDEIFGIGKSGNGQNVYGQFLQIIRDNIS